ncbi:DUF6722 family protein [Phocaeicola plebeius]|nr:DUF6722 family protein [Phocaeicola plebeius]MDY5979479.1 DUF6722 family protein [Phocaeicola plebeius]
MDIAKYITTAVVLTSIFGSLEQEWIIYIGGFISIINPRFWLVSCPG